MQKQSIFSPRVVFDSTKILILKQFTTPFQERNNPHELCLIVQRY